MILTIKSYGDQQWFVMNEKGTVECATGFKNVDAAIEWCDRNRPEAETRVARQEAQA